MRMKSCSRKNFAANLVRAVYKDSERATSNVNGRNGKNQLDPIRMKAIKEAIFKIYPCSTGETIPTEWADC